jgi:HEAT repeat protein
VLAVFVVLGTLAFLVFRTSEPVAQSRPLSSWLVDVDYNQPAATRERASKAIREIGTNALPYLLRDLDPPEESKLRRWLAELLRKQTFVKMRLRTSDQKNRQAVWAFQTLGPSAKPAIQQLVPLLETNPGYVPGALAGIGPDAVPHLCRALDSSNASVRGNTAAYLANAVWDLSIPKSNTIPAVPSLLRNLQDTNHLVRWNSASALGAVTHNPGIVVPALIRALNDSEGAVAEAAAQALGAFGSDAKQAIPALSAASQHKDSRRRSAAAEALKKVER